MNLPHIAFMADHEKQWYVGWDYGPEQRYHLDLELFQDGTHEWFYKDRLSGKCEGSDSPEREFSQRFYELMRQMGDCK